MAVKTFEISSYRVGLSQERSGRGGIKYSAWIVCEGDGHVYVIYFLRPDSRKWDDRYWPDRKVAMSFLPEEQYPWYIDLLRNEKPIFARLDSDPKGANYVYSGSEPTGEEESKFSASEID